MNATKTPDHSPTGRTRPKRKFSTVLRARLTKYRARVSEFEDDAPSSTVVRWLVVLLLLHLLVIGGVWVRSTWFKENTAKIDMASPLPVPPAITQQPATPAPAAPAQPAPAAPVTITQPDQVVDVRPSNHTPATPVAAPTRTDKPTAAPVAGAARHTVHTGDTWERIARDNRVSVQDLKAVNPKVQRLVSGSKLVIPARPGDKPAPARVEPNAAPEGTAHIVKKGETLSVIARKYKMDWRTVQKFNKMSDKDVARLKIGQTVMIPKK